jgi:glycosyltransferase involved in cell wall biosynthesis
MIKLDIVTDVSSPSGYAAHARALIQAIKNDIDIRVPPVKGNQVDVPLPKEVLDEYQIMIKKDRKPDAILYFCTPEFWEPKAGIYNIGWLQWESTHISNVEFDYPRRQIHPSKTNWVAMMNRMDEIWTGSNQAKQAFINSGVVRPIKIIQGPVDTNFYAPESPEIEPGLIGVTHEPDGTPIPREKRRFVVGLIGEWCKRKNNEAVLSTALTCLPPDRSIVVIKAHLNDVGTQRDELKKIVATVKNSLRVGKLAPVVLIDEMLSDIHMRGLMQTFDTYYCLSRGEGLNLPLVQCMSMEKVCIATNWSAHKDYMVDGKNGYLIDCVMKVVRGQEVWPEPVTPWYRGFWAEPDEGQACRALRHVFDVWAKDKGMLELSQMKRSARNTIVKQMSPEVAGSTAVNALAEAFRS